MYLSEITDNRPIRRIDLTPIKRMFTSDLQNIIHAIEAYDFNVRIVGGAVRDLLLGLNPRDIDLITDATPDELIFILEEHGIHPYTKGMKHGTIKIKFSEEEYEITSLSFAIDQECCPPHLRVKTGGSWKDDANRRDFTVDGFSVDMNGLLYDYLDGIKDLRNQFVKFIGSPAERIQKDPILIMRFFKLLSLFRNPKFDKSILPILKKKMKLVKKIKPARLDKEISNIHKGQSAEKVLKMMKNLGFDDVIADSEKELVSEGFSGQLCYWFNPRTGQAISLDNNRHHSEYVRKHPEVFGLPIDINNHYGVDLNWSANKNGWVRINLDNTAAYLDGISLSLLNRTARWLVKDHYIDQLILDVRDANNPNIFHDAPRLTGDALERFLRTGIVNKRVFEENLGVAIDQVTDVPRRNDDEIVVPHNDVTPHNPAISPTNGVIMRKDPMIMAPLDPMFENERGTINWRKPEQNTINISKSHVTPEEAKVLRGRVLPSIVMNNKLFVGKSGDVHEDLYQRHKHLLNPGDPHPQRGFYDPPTYTYIQGRHIPFDATELPGYEAKWAAARLRLQRQGAEPMPNVILGLGKHKRPTWTEAMIEGDVLAFKAPSGYVPKTGPGHTVVSESLTDISNEEALALFDEAQAIMRQQPQNIGRILQRGGKLNPAQEAREKRLHEIEKILPPNSPQWQRIWKMKRDEYDTNLATERGQHGQKELAKVQEYGFNIGDRVYMVARSWNPAVSGTRYDGIVKQSVNGTIYVAARMQGSRKTEKLGLLNNPWDKV